MCFVLVRVSLAGVSGGVGAETSVFLRCVRVMGEKSGYFSGHYYDRMYIILDFRNIFLDIQL